MKSDLHIIAGRPVSYWRCRARRQILIENAIEWLFLIAAWTAIIVGSFLLLALV